MSPANEERPSLYEFMPYGAPELMEVAKRYMVRLEPSDLTDPKRLSALAGLTNLSLGIRIQRTFPATGLGTNFLTARGAPWPLPHNPN